jgi:hypothetical protein
MQAILNLVRTLFYSPSPEYPVACHRDDRPTLKATAQLRWQGDAPKLALHRWASEGGRASANFALIPRSLLRGASSTELTAPASGVSVRSSLNHTLTVSCSKSSQAVSNAGRTMRGFLLRRGFLSRIRPPFEKTVQTLCQKTTEIS